MFSDGIAVNIDGGVDRSFKTVSLSDYQGKYVVLFFYPLDFTFVCPTEIIEMSDRYADAMASWPCGWNGFFVRFYDDPSGLSFDFFPMLKPFTVLLSSDPRNVLLF